ncbi:NAD(P)-dependent oxidoreductase [Macrococcus bovicus]|uniref:NAD(P)-dependent oxidoreductase n=1 Tax=Macrococcus bovicus TaxID=69968 RepID=A0A4R6BZ50_9STAP|nr:NAD(P)-dependent oxidoreductase [Macrococcus bovicus]TDM13427.1 NAD(P)-dependent oxidoreductase [Macrococcus bovicus]
MKIGIVGASGKAGRLILREALDRGHEVTAIVRDHSKVTAEVPLIEKDIHDLTREDIQHFDVLVNAFGAPLGNRQGHIDAGRALIKLVEGTDIRLIVLGGAGSLYTDDSKTVKVVDAPDFPDVIKPTASGQAQNLDELRQTTDINWTFLSPAGFFDPEGDRTGSYQLGQDVLLMNSKGESYISYADLAIAMVDEIEHAAHLKQRFTVVGERLN